MASPKPIELYDIASAEPMRTFAVNPWKARYALNFKRAHFETQWVQLPDIPSVRQKLGVPANRTLPNGEPYHTLPMIHDPATGQKIGDTFEIALYLDQTYPAPEYPVLFRPGTTGLTAALNAQIDGLFTKHIAIVNKMPFDPARKDEIDLIFARRFGMSSAIDLQASDQAREQAMTGLENGLGELLKAYKHSGGTTDYFWSPTGTAKEQAQVEGRKEESVWLDGEEPVYADLIVGAWLAMMEASLGEADWVRMRGWQGGFWGRLHDRLGYLRDMK